MQTHKPSIDTRREQFERVADFLEAQPRSTVKQIDAACDLGSPTKVISEMRRQGYVLRATWQYTPCVSGSKLRQVLVLELAMRPNAKQPSLFPTA
jgi:hypothetical protein